VLPPCAEIMHAFAPGAVAAGFEMIAHDDLHSIRAQPGLRGDGGEADMSDSAISMISLRSAGERD